MLNWLYCILKLVKFNVFKYYLEFDIFFKNIHLN